MCVSYLSGAEHSDWHTVIQWDNDLLTGTDRGYTNGARIALQRELDPNQETHNALQHALLKVSGAENDLVWGDEGRFSDSEALRFSWGIGITQLMFTPRNPNTPTAPNGERPYAGWLGMEFALNVSDRDSVGGVTLSIGTTGKNSYAENAQEWVHTHISDSPIFQGWDSQVAGEPTLNLHFDRKEKLSIKGPSEDLGLDGYYEWGAALGNFRTNAYIGTLIRFGYQLPNTYATPRVQLGSYGHALFEPDSTERGPLSIYGFTGIRGTAVLHDITLDGPLFRDSNSTVESKPFVGELILGLATRIHSFDLSLSQTLRTDEFKGQTSAHDFGSIMLRFELPF